MLRAGCPRVTHPFAARTPPPKRRASLDLHVLSTPPAFVLSQDQTLRRCFIGTAPKGRSQTSEMIMALRPFPRRGREAGRVTKLPAPPSTDTGDEASVIGADF